MSGKKRIIIILTVLVGIALIVMLVSRLGSNNTKTSSSKPKPVVVKPMVATDFVDRDSKVVLTIDGKINGDDQHRAIRITVGRDFRTAEVIQGYEGKVIKSQNDVNNKTAYTDFLFAISRYNFAKERKTTQPEDRGACPLGQRYIYEIYDNNDQKMRRWAASCGSMGTSAASPSQVNDLFQKQVTEYFKFITGVQL